MTSAIIVEDEYLAREELSYLVKKYSPLEIVATFDDGLDAFKFLQTQSPDVVFLDINVPSIDGVMLAKNLHQKENSPEIIFTTAYKEHAAEAFDIEAFDYILKPLSEQRVKRSLEKLMLKFSSNANVEANSASTLQAESSHLPLQDGHTIKIVDKSQILYACANEKVTQVYVLDDKKLIKLVANYSISDLISRLDSSVFYRCHRSYCVNLNHIAKVKPGLNSTYLLSFAHFDEKIPVSRANVKTFRSLMGI